MKTAKRFLRRWREVKYVSKSGTEHVRYEPVLVPYNPEIDLYIPKDASKN